MMQLQVQEASAMVLKEREAARKAIEEAPPVIKEIPVIVQDTEKINSLTNEMERLKVNDYLSRSLGGEEFFDNFIGPSYACNIINCLKVGSLLLKLVLHPTFE